MKEKEGGIFIPFKFFRIEGLTRTEQIVLSLYKYYTEMGYRKGCTYSNQEIADLLNCSRRNVIDIKNHLRELGYIKVEGRKVMFQGIVRKNGEPQHTRENREIHQNSEPQLTLDSEAEFTRECSAAHQNSEAQLTTKVKCSSLINIKKEKIEKKKKNRETPKGFEDNSYSLSKEEELMMSRDFQESRMSKSDRDICTILDFGF